MEWQFIEVENVISKYVAFNWGDIMGQFDVFLSFKNTDLNGNTTKDREMAANLYKELTQKGINVFFSEETLRSLGAAQYKDAIDDALDDAKVLIVVGTSVENITSNWVRYEWDSFYGDILSGKKEGQLFSYIDGINIKDLPRTLRQVQTFDASREQIESICEYIVAALNFGIENNIDIKDTNILSLDKNVSKYSSVKNNEPVRLSYQADTLYKNDVNLLKPIIEKLSSKKKINVLDIGCANGYLTNKLFNNFSDSINLVVGIDHEKDCIMEAKHNFSKQFCFYNVEVESDDLENKLGEIVEENNIESFDLVFSAFVLHHLNEPIKMLKKLRKYVSNDGILYIRSCDDGDITVYPDEKGLIKKVLKAAASIPGMSDREHGRKLYYQLYKSGYKVIEMESHSVTTAEMDIDERIHFCHEMLEWPRKRYKNLVDMNPQNESYLKQYNEFCSDYEQIEEMFYDPAFYYRLSGPIAIATK